TAFNDLFFFFFSSRRRHTRSKRDWSSDVCSSDLAADTLEDLGHVMVVGEVVECALRCGLHGDRRRELHPSHPSKICVWSRGMTIASRLGLRWLRLDPSPARGSATATSTRSRH